MPDIDLYDTLKFTGKFTQNEHAWYMEATEKFGNVPNKTNKQLCLEIAEYLGTRTGKDITQH